MGLKKGIAETLFGGNLRSLNSPDNPNVINALEVIAKCYDSGIPLRTIQFACFPEVNVVNDLLIVDWNGWEESLYDTVSRTIGPLERLITRLMEFEVDVAPILLVDDKEVTEIRMLALGIQGDRYVDQMKSVKEIFRGKLLELLSRNGISGEILFTSEVWEDVNYSDNVTEMRFNERYINREVAFLKQFYPQLSQKILVKMAKIRLNQYRLQGLALTRMCEADSSLIILGMEYPVRQSVGQLGLLNTGVPVIFPATDSEVQNI